MNEKAYECLPDPSKRLPPAGNGSWEATEMRNRRTPLRIALCVLIGSLLFGCGKTEQPAVTEAPTPVPDSGAAIVFVNGLQQADVWILPETEKNLKTTVWGTATIAKLDTDGEQRLSLDALGGPGVYILRMIDTHGMYYAVDGIALEDGYTVRISRGEEPPSALVEVTDSGGAAVASYTAFAARL